MKYYVGLDVSLQETFIVILDQNGKMIKEAVVLSDPKSIGNYLLAQNIEYEKIGIESGQLSIYLCKGLIERGLNAICVDARHMSKLLSAKINKNDRNDGYGIANMMRVNLYKEVKIKSDSSCQIKILLGGRRQLVRTRQQIMGTIRGLLKIHGIKIPPKILFKQKYIMELLKDSDNISKLTIKSLLSSLTQIEKSLFKLNKEAIKLTKKDQDCKLLTTIPGVGSITAMTYKAALDEAERFKDSYTVGAYMGLTPRQYASGEIDRHGSISKMGPKECRTMLYEAAQSLLARSRKKSKLKTWGLKIAKKKGNKKAIVATARKLSVIMHQMLIDRKEFCYQ